MTVAAVLAVVLTLFGHSVVLLQDLSLQHRWWDPFGVIGNVRCNRMYRDCNVRSDYKKNA
jgi:hypothetical protein